ncbi:MAG: hypothetical protein ABSG41_24665 [Bryobacteraceae bacterium]
MKPKLMALNVALLLAIGAIAWQARVRWQATQVERRQNLSVAVKPVTVPPLKPTPRPDAAQPVQYADVATKNLFSKDRNPTVVIDPPKVEAPKPMPPLPVVYGVLGLPSGTKAIMAEKRGADGRSVKTGDTVGDFKIVSLDTKDVVFDWDGTQISRKLDDLIDRSGATGATGGAQGLATQTSGPAVAAPAPGAANNQPAIAASPGKPIPGAAARPCVPGDNSPSGTVVDGYRKTFAATPFGPMGCRWLPVQ